MVAMLCMYVCMLCGIAEGTDFEGGVATAAFVTGGALPSHLYGQVSNSPMHVADLHFTICLLAGLSDTACRDDDIVGVPPIDGVDVRKAFEEVNVTRPIAEGSGASAGTQEIVLSGSVVGAYIDFNLSNGGPWKFVQSTAHVLKNTGSPNGSGYWTGPRWPVGNNHAAVGGPGQMEPDPGCPVGGCLFVRAASLSAYRRPYLSICLTRRCHEFLILKLCCHRTCASTGQSTKSSLRSSLLSMPACATEWRSFGPQLSRLPLTSQRGSTTARRLTTS